MFNLFRSRDKSVRILLGVLLGLVALSMVTYLIPSGPGTGGPAGDTTVVAKVGSETVTAQEVSRTTCVPPLTGSLREPVRAIVAAFAPAVPLTGSGVPLPTGINVAVPDRSLPTCDNNRSSATSLPSGVEQVVQPTGVHVRIAYVPCQCPASDCVGSAP